MHMMCQCELAPIGRGRDIRIYLFPIHSCHSFVHLLFVRCSCCCCRCWLLFVIKYIFNHWNCVINNEYFIRLVPLRRPSHTCLSFRHRVHYGYEKIVKHFRSTISHRKLKSLNLYGFPNKYIISRMHPAILPSLHVFAFAKILFVLHLGWSIMIQNLNFYIESIGLQIPMRYRWLKIHSRSNFAPER